MSFDSNLNKVHGPGWLSCCQGYTHMPWCPQYIEKAAEAATEAENVSERPQKGKEGTSGCCERCDESDRQEQQELTLNLVQGLLRKAAQGCNCELHRLSPEACTARIDTAIDAVNAEIANGQLPPPDFDECWTLAPTAMKRVTERECAEYFYRCGLRDASADALTDVKEMERLMKKRMGR